MGHTYIINYTRKKKKVRKEIINVPGYSIECPAARYDLNLFL